MQEDILSKQNNVKYAGFGMRMLAATIDVFSTIVLIPIFNIFDRIYGTNQIRMQLQETLEKARLHPEVSYSHDIIQVIIKLSAALTFQMLFVAVIVITLWIYFCATPGKMLLKMRIVDANTGGTPSKRQFIIRFVASILSLLPCCLGFIWIFYDKKHQGWHDKIARTVVVYCNKKGDHKAAF